MIDISHELQIVELYKESKITEYVLQQELSNLVGPNSDVLLHKDSKPNTTNSFGIFVAPEMRVEGLKLHYFIDKSAIDNFYTPEELLDRLVEIARMKQAVMKECFKFARDHREIGVSFGEALAELLRIYQSTLSILRVPGKDFIPDESRVAAYVVELEDGKVDSNIEKLSVESIIPEEVIEIAKKMAKAPEAGEITITFTDDEKPSFNIGGQEIRSFADGTYDYDKMHKDIPWDYKPSTNQ